MGRCVRLTGAEDERERKAETMVRRGKDAYLVDTGKLSLEIPLPENGTGAETWFVFGIAGCIL